MTVHHSLIFISNPASSMTVLLSLKLSVKLTSNPCISSVKLQMKVLGSAKESPLQAILDSYFYFDSDSWINALNMVLHLVLCPSCHDCLLRRFTMSCETASKALQ